MHTYELSSLVFNFEIWNSFENRISHEWILTYTHFLSFHFTTFQLSRATVSSCEQKVKFTFPSFPILTFPFIFFGIIFWCQSSQSTSKREKGRTDYHDDLCCLKYISQPAAISVNQPHNTHHPYLLKGS